MLDLHHGLIKETIRQFNSPFKSHDSHRLMLICMFKSDTLNATLFLMMRAEQVPMKDKLQAVT